MRRGRERAWGGFGGNAYPDPAIITEKPTRNRDLCTNAPRIFYRKREVVRIFSSRTWEAVIIELVSSATDTTSVLEALKIRKKRLAKIVDGKRQHANTASTTCASLLTNYLNRLKRTSKADSDTHTITITAIDSVGNTSTATTTFTVNTVKTGGFTFSLDVSPATVKRGKMAKLDIAFANTSAQRLFVSFTVRYTSPCGSFVLDNVGPVPINAGVNKSANVPFHVPKTACAGQYTLTLEAYVGGVLVGTDTAVLTVTP